MLKRALELYGTLSLIYGLLNPILSIFAFQAKR